MPASLERPVPPPAFALPPPAAVPPPVAEPPPVVEPPPEATVPPPSLPPPSAEPPPVTVPDPPPVDVIHAPRRHTSVNEQTAQALPATPQLLVELAWHTPALSQHPSGQVVGEHWLAVPHDGSVTANAAPRSNRRSVLMNAALTTLYSIVGAPALFTERSPGTRQPRQSPATRCRS